jgi:hypothetical protein
MLVSFAESARTTSRWPGRDSPQRGTDSAASAPVFEEDLVPSSQPASLLLTEPHYLPALAAHFNTIAYHFDEARNACLANENVLLELKKQKADAEEAGHVFLHLDTYRQAERVWEGAMKRFNDFAEDLAACWRLIERCKSALDVARDGDTQLVAVGTAGDVHIAFEETESELLQLAGVCEKVELYPSAGKRLGGLCRAAGATGIEAVGKP